MTRLRLASLAAYAGDKLRPGGPLGPIPFGSGIPAAARARNAVYVVCAWSGQVLYVGSTTIGVRSRFLQHLRNQPKTLDWSTVYIIPLTDDTSVADVRRIEGRVGLAAAPLRNRALPRLAARR
ncbi:GIY-YIG nuclease family protein [Micromonospora sp. C41]|uniref:GIY-YIG nuclease family protein n=1 Tax=Micromonospora sp. C41 TaxID=2824878 RepID=UPI001B37D5C9|nr:GIY-YIG nuclease family protein [Micromonospora sp. C41]MBQ1062159.1 GIY-YIG nuclease family protein [Micromonospora sp. C41]